MARRVQKVKKEAWDRSPVTAWLVSQRSHAPVRHASQRPRAGFMAATLDGAECPYGSAKEEPRCSTRLIHTSFRRWQYAVPLCWFNANALPSRVIARWVLPQFFIITYATVDEAPNPILYAKIILVGSQPGCMHVLVYILLGDCKEIRKRRCTLWHWTVQHPNRCQAKLFSEYRKKVWLFIVVFLYYLWANGKVLRHIIEIELPRSPIKHLHTNTTYNVDQKCKNNKNKI